MKRWRVAGICFDHFHMGDLLRLAQDHPGVEVVGICDEQPARMTAAQKVCGLREDQIFSDPVKCLSATAPEIVILCPAAARHAEWTELVAPQGVHILMEKPFASSLAEADRMIAAMAATGKQLAINWPLRWYRSHIKAHELVTQGAIGELREVHFYDGNRGPLYHGADKVEREPTAAEKDASWFYRQAEGGGSLLDYLGYGTTLGTWFHQGRKPIEVMAMWDEPTGLEVDEHSLTVARYEVGLSKFETRWGTFTDPWTLQPQPKCGFVLVGSEGSISSYDYDDTVRLADRAYPGGRDVAAPLPPTHLADPVHYLVHCLERRLPVDGPLGIETARIGQQIVDTAFASAKRKQTLPLMG